MRFFPNNYRCFLGALLKKIQDKPFAEKISGFFEQVYSQDAEKLEDPTVIEHLFNDYSKLYKDETVKLFASVKLPESQIEPSWDFLLLSDSGLCDNKTTTEHLASENREIFSKLAQYYKLYHEYTAAGHDVVCYFCLSCMSLVLDIFLPIE